MRNSRPASVCAMPSTTPTSSTSPVNTSNSSFRARRGCINRHLIVVEPLRRDQAPPLGLLHRRRSEGGEGVHRARAEDDGCPEDNQPVHQSLLDKGGCEGR